MEKLLIIPTYNEKENIAAILETVFSLQQNFHVLIIDDGSPDGTADDCKRSFCKICRKVISRRDEKASLAWEQHIYMGFKWALDNGYKYIFEMDCDFSHNPA